MARGGRWTLHVSHLPPTAGIAREEVDRARGRRPLVFFFAIDARGAAALGGRPDGKPVTAQRNASAKPLGLARIAGFHVGFLLPRPVVAHLDVPRRPVLPL